MSERWLRTVTAVAMWWGTTIAIFAVSFIPAAAPENVNFWRLVLAVPAVALGFVNLWVGPRISEERCHAFAELTIVPALLVTVILLQITPATEAVLFEMLVPLIYMGYFARLPALALTLTAAVFIAFSTLLFEPASSTPYLASFLAVYVPTIILTPILLHLQNNETLDALDDARRRALSDPLTGLANLRALERRAEREFMPGVRHPEGVLGLLLIDLDNFKSANTKHGHIGGDHALRMVAKQLLRVAPRGSVVARVGGDEFAVLLRRDTRERVVESAEIFRAAVRAASAIMDMPGVEIDAAVGIATYPEDGNDLSALLDTADKAMYAEKGAKRHAFPNLEAVPDDPERRSAWISSDAVPAIKQHRSATLDELTGGRTNFWGSRSLYARTSALAWAVGSVVLGISLLVPDHYDGAVLPWWVVMFGGLALSVGIFFVNAQPRSLLHVTFDFGALLGIGAIIALTGGFASAAPPLLILLVASQAWFWQTEQVALRIIGPVLIAISPAAYQSVADAPQGTISVVTVYALAALIVTLVISMYYDRRLLSGLERRAEQLALVDPLTGIRNRRAFDAYVNEMLDPEMPSDRFAIVMIDLDNFKQVNTASGHRAGDRVLRAIAAQLEHAAREDDCVARVGGDEFAAVLRGVGVDGARSLAERFVETVSETPEAREAGVSASAGFALYPLHGTTLDKLVFTADSALMAVKATGKGSARVARVVSAVQ